MNKPLWQPDADAISQSRMVEFMNFARQYGFHGGSDYGALHHWSVRHKKDFWEAIREYFDILGDFENCHTLENNAAMPGAEWFVGSQLNFAENLLRRRDDSPAIIAIGEDGRRSELSFNSLYRKVATLAQQLAALGVKPGDRVAGFLPNSEHAVIAMLATTSLGAIWSSCSPDFGKQGVIDRFGQIKPKVLFATNGYQYNGKPVFTSDRVDEIAGLLPELKSIICLPYLTEAPLPGDTRTMEWSQIFSSGNHTEEIDFKPMDFNAPLYIMYSSGTTGAPKCIVHGSGGTLLQHVKELGLHTNIKPGDRIFYFTTCGWMMWNWLVSSLALNATLILYDGSPFYPGPARLFDLAEQEAITVFGAGAKFYAAADKADVKPAQTHNMKALRTILSTGSPLAHETFDYLYRDVKKDICVSSISGGTDIISCFALGNPLLPVYRGELQCPGLGMDVDFYSEDGKSLATGKGELVCKSPFPSMPIYFWNDPGNEKYQKAYFKQFPGIWAHGDFGEFVHHESENGIPEQRGIIIHGRSDAVLNPGGVRIGTAEIYRQVESIPEVLESICIGQEWDKDVRVVLFVKLRQDVELSNELQTRIRNTIRTHTSPRHVPAKILAVSDIPRTISGKIVEIAVREVVHGKEVKNKDALANPGALELYKNLPELQS